MKQISGIDLGMIIGGLKEITRLNSGQNSSMKFFLKLSSLHDNARSK